jgi:hypothetical protein
MNELALALLLTGFFLALKAIEHRPDAPTYPLMSIGAWVSFAAGLVALLIA